MPNEAEVKYGYCPRCGAKSVDRERRLNGNDRCENGHQYPSAHATPNPWLPGKQPPPQAEVVASSHRPEWEKPFRDEIARLVGHIDWLSKAYMDVVKNGNRMTITMQPPPAQGKEAPYGYCPKCGARGVRRERCIDGNDTCFNGHVYPSADAHTKEAQCSNESGVGCSVTNAGPASASNASRSTAESSNTEPLNATSDAPAVTPSSIPNPPAWATPQIHKIRFNLNDYVLFRITNKGKEVYADYYAGLRLEPPPFQDEHYEGVTWQRMQIWEMCMIFGAAMFMGAVLPVETEMVMYPALPRESPKAPIPTPPAAKCEKPACGFPTNATTEMQCPVCEKRGTCKPAAKCDGSGDVLYPHNGGIKDKLCPGCSACKPEPKDGVEGMNLEDRVINTSADIANRLHYACKNEGVTIPQHLLPGLREHITTAITAAILADREKQAARPATELRGKVWDLADYVKLIVPADSQMGRLAREVLAQLEAP